MSDKPEYLDYSELILELDRLCVEKRTGTYFVTSDDKHIAVFTIDEGRLTGCRYRGKSGYDALDLIKNINKGVTRFAEGMFTSMGDVPLPSTGEILNTLSRASHATRDVSREARQSQEPGGEGADTAAVEKIRLDLARYLGPVAGMYCNDYEEEHGKVRTDAQAIDMVHALAREIGNRDKEKQFIDQAMKSLSSQNP